DRNSRYQRTPFVAVRAVWDLRPIAVVLSPHTSSRPAKPGIQDHLVVLGAHTSESSAKGDRGGCPDATLGLQQLIRSAGPLLADADGGRRDRAWLVLGGLGGAAGPAGVDCVGAGVAEVDGDLGGRLGVDRAGGGEVDAVAGLDGDR